MENKVWHKVRGEMKASKGASGSGHIMGESWRVGTLEVSFEEGKLALARKDDGTLTFPGVLN